MLVGNDLEVLLPGRMLQVSGDCEDNKNVSAFIDGRGELNGI